MRRLRWHGAGFVRAFYLPGSMRELRWWIAVQVVYARSIGSTFAKPANDNGARACDR